jgi:hypothetical protein
MKVTTVFQCEKCGRTYNNTLECEVCENSHRQPIEIIRSVAEGGLFDYYPSCIFIKFDNGEIKKYYFDRLT